MKENKTLSDHAIVIVNRSFIGILLLIISKYFSHPALFLVTLAAGVGLLVNAILYSRKHYKCPHCGAPLPLKGGRLSGFLHGLRQEAGLTNIPVIPSEVEG